MLFTRNLAFQKAEEEQSLHNKLEFEIDNTNSDINSLTFFVKKELKSIQIIDKKLFEKEIEIIHNWFDEKRIQKIES